MIGRSRTSAAAVRNTGNATASAGGVAVSGVVDTIQVGYGAPARSRYVEQVRQLAPSALVGRDAELEELAAFSIAADPAPTYVWWRAQAWTGKSALMAWFVLHPPVGVRVVSFFITARYAGQSDRIAFTDVVLEQLADLLDLPMPGYLTEATRAAHLWGLLTEAAALCLQRGERLVLVVDGLDEDRGVVAGPDAYSIAALLPTRTPAGLRVIVSGRPNPPIPADVPVAHPLRDAAAVRVLGPSSYAQVVRQDAQRELRQLLHGTQAEQDLLGLLTAAGGGLALADLADLTGWPAAQVDEHLATVSGRTFNRHRARWHPDPTVYVLGHEELQQQATREIGGARLDDYRQRLHAWADTFRVRGWPPDTPEYVLRGYVRLLSSLGDTDRMFALAVDPDRQLRLRVTSGGDYAALSEINATQTRLASDDADLCRLGRLAVHRVHLAERGASIPRALPTVWALLGRLSHAETLARSITAPDSRAWALADLARVVAAAGDLDQAAALAEQAATVAQTLIDRTSTVWAVAHAACALAGAGRTEQALALAESISGPEHYARALAGVIRAVSITGDADRAAALAERAESAARRVPRPYFRARTFVDVAKGVAATGDRARA